MSKNNANKQKLGQWEIIKKVLKYLGKYRKFLWLSLVFAVVSVLLTLYIPKLTGEVVDYMVDKGQVDFGGVKKIIIKIVISAVIVGIAQWLMNLCNNKMTYNIVRDIRNDAFDKIENLPLSYIDSHSYGSIQSRVISDVDQFADGLLMGFTQLFTGVVTILGTLCFMFSVNVVISIVVVVVTPVSFLVAGFISKSTYKMFRKQSEIRGEQTGFINEMVEGARVVKAYNQKENTMKKFDKLNDELTETSLKAIFFMVFSF